MLGLLIELSQVSDGLIGMVRILQRRLCDESSVACHEMRWFFDRKKVLEVNWNEYYPGASETVSTLAP